MKITKLQSVISCSPFPQKREHKLSTELLQRQFKVPFFEEMTRIKLHFEISETNFIYAHLTIPFNHSWKFCSAELVEIVFSVEKSLVWTCSKCSRKKKE